MTLAALIFACLAVIADAWSTRVAIMSGSIHEANPVREWLIERLGWNGGTYGLSAAVCVAMALAYWRAGDSVAATFCYVLVFCAVAYVTYGNLQKIRRR